jgi:radical SAM protein with 4Fe4S-binding SPASM domain
METFVAQPLSIIERESRLFRNLRDTNKLEGKCGACESKQICRGSRAELTRLREPRALGNRAVRMYPEDA